MRLTMVVREPQRAAAQRAAGTLAQGEPFNPALVTQGGDPFVVTARWCSWEMLTTERDNLLAAFRAQGFTARESTVIDAARTPNAGDQLFAFDGAAWTPAKVLAALSFEPIRTEE